MIKSMDFRIINYKVKNHLLTIHPFLKDIKYQDNMDRYEFISKYEKEFGYILPVTKLGTKLPKVSSYIHSNDSEFIADLLTNFKYDQNKTNEILTKYKKIK